MRLTKLTVGRLAMVTATGGFMMGIALLNSGGAHAIGGLCNGRPASHTWLDASGQYGPAVLDGTKGDDVLIHDGAGHIKADGGADFDDCLISGGDEVTNCEY